MAIPDYSQLEGYPTKEQRGDFTSNAASEAGSGPDRTLPADSSNHVFSSDGFDPSGSDPMIWDLSDFMSGGDITALATECYHHWELSDGFNSDDAPLSSEYGFTSFNSINGWCSMQPDGDFIVKWGSGQGQSGGEFDVSSTAIVTGDGVVFDSWWDSTGVYTFANSLLLDYQPAITFSSGAFTNYYVGGVTTVNTNYNGETIRNAQISRLAPAIQQDAHGVLHLGTSLTVQGGPASRNSSPAGDSLKLPWIATNTTNGTGYTSSGYAAGDTNQEGAGGFRDAGMIPTIYRQLGKSGVFPFDDNRNHAQSGGEVSDAIVQLAAVTGGFIPTICICELGTNDAGKLVSDATFEANYKTLLTDLYELGVQRVVVTTIPTLSADSSFRTTAHYDSVDNKNAIIKNLVAWASSTLYNDNFLFVADTAPQFGSRENFVSGLWTNEGEVTEVAINAAGTGYIASEVLSVTGGGGVGAQLTIDTVGGSGEITAVSISNPGSGYTSAPTGFTGGSGAGADLPMEIGNIHPNELGSYTFGLTVGNKAVAALSTTSISSTGIMQPIMASGY